MMLVIRTQVYENYGDADKPYWKPKGGSEYKILGVPLDVDFAEVVTAAGVTRSDSYFEENIIDWSIENDDYISKFERDQLEYEGRIVFAEPTLEYADLVADTVG